MFRRRSKWVSVFLLAAAGCHTTHTEISSQAGTEIVTVTRPVRAWKLEQDGQLRGFVVLFADPRRRNDTRSQLFSVRNAWHQELGSIDGLGRAWSFVPHQREAQWMGTGTVLEGARSILGGSNDSVLDECDLSELRGVLSHSPES